MTFGKDKCRFTAVLAIIASGKKLPPLIICKGKVGKRKEIQLNSLECVKNKTIYVKCQENSWCDTNIFKFWVNNIFLYYQNFIIKKKCLLIFDKATSHINNDVIAFLKEKNIDYIIIPGGFTKYLQPLDVAINKPFKMALKKEYLKFQQQHLNDIVENKFTITNEDMIQIINDIWQDNNYIKTETIINSFLYCGISQKQDGSQDEFFKWPDAENYLDSEYDLKIINDLD